jgi:DNA-directed RNA polymerase subunit F
MTKRAKYNEVSGEYEVVDIPAEEVDEMRAAALAAVKPARIEELRRLLASTDYKVLPDYDQQDPAISAQRQAWRDEIRALEAP